MRRKKYESEKIRAKNKARKMRRKSILRTQRKAESEKRKENTM